MKIYDRFADEYIDESEKCPYAPPERYLELSEELIINNAARWFVNALRKYWEADECKTEPQKDCKKCKNYDRCKNNHWKCCVYEPKTEPQGDDKHAVCTGCDYYDLPNAFHPCASCVDFSKYKPKIEDEPQTDCAWKGEE